MTVLSKAPAVTRRGTPVQATPSRKLFHGTVGRKRRSAGTIALFLAPALVLVFVLLIVPFIFTVYRSFTSDNGLSRSWVGLDNYVSLFTDPEFGQSILNTAMWTAGLFLPVLLGLLIAVAANSSGFGRVARFSLILPYALSGSVTAILWNFMLASDGAVNSILGGIGLASLQHNWLLQWPLNTVVMILATTWQATGATMLLFLVGLQSIPTETIEAARLDGAGGARLLRKIVLPQLKPITIVVVGISLVGSLKTFDIVWLLTAGGPGTSSETLALTMYRETFTLNRYGYGAAVAVVLTIVVLAASWIYLRRQLKPADD